MSQQKEYSKKRTTSFAEQVLAAASRIPRGRVATYRDIAEAIGAPNAYRAAGNALNKNPHPVTVPCHRVVRADGRVGGYGGGGGAKKKTTLLMKEGVRVVNGRIDLTRFGVSGLSERAGKKPR